MPRRAAQTVMAWVGEGKLRPHVDRVLPLAHAGHYIWTLYIPPVAIVVFSIVKTTISERRKAREEEEEEAGKGGAGKGKRG